MANTMEGPLGPIFPSMDPIWIFVGGFSWINIGVALIWFAVLHRKWRLNRTDLVLRLQLMTVIGAILGQSCIVTMTLIWPNCTYPYIYVVPPTHHGRCGANIYHRLSNMIFFASMGAFNMAFLHRFLPAYIALGLPYANRVHLAVYAVIWSTNFMMPAASIVNLIRKDSEQLELYDLHSAISLFEEYTPLAAAAIMGCVNLGIASMGFTIILRSLKEVNDQFYKSESKAFQTAHYFRLTFGLLIIGVFIFFVYGLCWFKNIPVFSTIPMVVLVNLRVFLCLLYMTVTFLALNTFIQAVRLQQDNSSNPVTTTWIQHDLGSKYETSNKGIPITPLDSQATEVREESGLPSAFPIGPHCQTKSPGHV
jgi:hypothetical protein